MHGIDEQTGVLLSYLSLEKFVPSDYPLWLVRGLLNKARSSMIEA